MIPVLGVPYINRPDLLERMVGSIPEGLVQKLVIIDNSWTRDCPQLPGAMVISTGTNLGVAASWNLIIKTTPRAPWWAIVNADLEFRGDDLVSLAEAMGDHEMVLLYSMAAFGVRPSVIKNVGWFDENFVPAYCEDNDFIWRCHLLDQRIEFLPAAYDHFGSATIKSSEVMRINNDSTYPMNVEYYQRKWGGVMHQEVYTTPFDKGGSPRDWTLDIDRLSKQMWSPDARR